MKRLLALFPRWWRDRYGDEMWALLDLARPRTRDHLDLARGALDAWLHPPAPSRLPALAALLGGGLWTTAAARVVGQPVPPDWPGYLEEVVPIALVAVGCLLVAILGIAIRFADAAGRAPTAAVGIVILGYAGWLLALGLTALGTIGGATLGAAQAIAMVGTAAVGAVLWRHGEDRVGALVVIAAATMFVPWTGIWLIFGACWTAIGLVLVFDRVAVRPSTRR